MASITTFSTSTTPTALVPALTTTFTPAASCLTDLYLYSILSGGSQWDYRQLGPSPTSDCYPPKFTPTPSAYYSPGICPTYYSIACSSVVAIGSVSETRATCCPSAYSCQTFSEGWPWYSTELCTYAGTATSTFLLTKATTVSTSVGTPDFNAYGIQIRWQQSDTAVPSTTSASSTTTSTPALTSATPLATSTSPSSSNTTSGLSTGAKAGIGIGAAIGGLLVLAGIIFLILRRRKAAINEQGATNTTQTQHYYAEVEAGDTERKARQPFHELPAHARKQISPAELSTES